MLEISNYNIQKIEVAKYTENIVLHKLEKKRSKDLIIIYF